VAAARRIRRTPARPPRTIVCGAEDRGPLTEVAPADPAAESRVITLRGGARWLVTVVARLVSEDVAARTQRARLVLRFECLTHPHRPVRVATVRARELHAVDDRTLRALATVPAARARQAAIRRLEQGG
jgi:hypothetical protein